QRDLIRRHRGPPRVFEDRPRIGGLVDALAAEPAVLFLDHVRPDPADAVRHLFVTNPGGTAGGEFELSLRRPCASTPDSVGVHRRSSSESVSPRGGSLPLPGRNGPDVGGCDRLATEAPITARDLLENYYRVLAQVLAFDRDHRLGKILDHPALLRL